MILFMKNFILSLILDHYDITFHEHKLLMQEKNSLLCFW